MKHGSLFSGIGGFDLAAEWMGWENVFHCEWNPFGQKVLHHYWPNAIQYHDITTTDFTIHKGTIDILTGGFPCQPYSMAGKRLGKEDERHLWPEMCRAIREIAPRYVVGENVLGLTNWNGGLVFDEVHSDLESAGYEVQAVVIPAAAVNAPHGRDRVWFVAHAKDFGSPFGKLGETKCGKQIQAGCNFNGHESVGLTADTEPKGRKRPDRVTGSVRFKPGTWDNWPTTEPVIRGGDDGISRELDGITFSKWRNESIKAYGNAVVPQVVFQIFKAIEIIEDQK